jgi:LL-diaminopimelate aminotransferase
MPAQSARLDKLPAYIFAVIADQLSTLRIQGADVIRLDIGNPDMPPPDAVIDALCDSARQPANHGYTGYRGTPEFKQAIAQQYEKRFGVSLDPNTEVLPLIGSKEGIVNMTLAYIDAGDVALVPDIGYPSYAMGTRLAGGEIHWMPLNTENGFKPNVDEIPADIAKKAKILWTNYPNNPTSAFADNDFYEKVAAFCNKNDILFISDNPYMDVTYDGYSACSALQTSYGKKNVVEFFSFSKSYNIAGWRLGAALGDADAIKKLLHVKSNVDTGHFKAVYDAGIAALQTTPQSWIDDRNKIYQERRDLIVEALPKIGLSAETPHGSLYAWGKIEKPSLQDNYTERARTEAHVSMAPGIAYGPGGEGYVRISLAVKTERLKEALNRLEKWYATT